MIKRKKLVVVPLAGLGNRMRVLSKCVQIAKDENRSLYVAWPINSALGCSITDIFESIGVEYFTPPKWINTLLTQIYRTGAIKRFFPLYKIVSKFFFDNSVFDDDIVDDRLMKVKPLKLNNQHTKLLVATCLSFSEDNESSNWNDYLKNENSRQLFKNFRFTDHLNNKIDEEYLKLSNNYIGIHIRRTDHATVIKYSPIENYLKHIDKCLTINPTQKFFLATDDEVIKKFIFNKYKGLVYIFNSKLGRGDAEGIYGGIIELMLLSKSVKIICSMISSYSSAAILIGDIHEVMYV